MTVPPVDSAAAVRNALRTLRLHGITCYTYLRAEVSRLG